MARVFFTGVKAFVANLFKSEQRIALGVERGVYKAGRFLQRESMLIVPVDLSPLIQSADTHKTGSGFSTVAHVSYNTEYAIIVHEDLNANHKPGKQAKFLEQPAREKAGRILEIIKEEAKKS